MKERAPAFQFFPRQFAGDDQVMAMDLDAVGAHILLMCAAAASPEGYRIDAEEYAIRMRVRNPDDADWQRIKRQLLAGAWKVSSDGRWWVQDGLQRTLLKQKKFSADQRERANRRWCRTDTESMPEVCRTDAEMNAESVPKVCSSSSSSSSNTNKQGAEAFNSTEVAQIVVRESGWSGPRLILALKDAIEFQSKQKPESSLEEIAQQLVNGYREHRATRGKFAVGVEKYFSEGLYQSVTNHQASAVNVLADNLATRAQAQLEEANA